MVKSVNKQFIIAVRNNNIEQIEYFLKKGANTDYCDSEFGSAIITAVTRQNVQALQLLLQYGACVNKVNQFNVSPVEIAIKLANSTIINLLVEHGATLKKASSSFYLRQLKRYINPLAEQNKSF